MKNSSKNNKKIILSVAMLFVSSVFVIFFMSSEVSAASYNDDGLAEERYNECRNDTRSYGENIAENMCGRYNNPKQWAYSYSTYLNAERTGSEIMSRTTSSFGAQIYSISNTSSTNQFTGKMQDKITSYVCEVQNDGKKVGSCSTNLVGIWTGTIDIEYHVEQTQTSSSSGFKINVPNTLSDGVYSIKLKVTSEVYVNGNKTTGSFSTSEISNLTFEVKNEEPEKVIEEPDPVEPQGPLKIYEISGKKITFNYDGTQYIPIILSCEPDIEIGEATKNISGYNEYEDGAYILNKENKNIEVNLSVRATAKYADKEPTPILNGAFLEVGISGDVDYTDACKNFEEKNVSKTETENINLENGELKFVELGEDLKLDANTEIVMYARPVSISCNETDGCKSEYLPLIVWDDKYYINEGLEATKSFFKNLVTVVKGLVTGGVKCADQLTGYSISDSEGNINLANIFLNIRNFTVCWVDEVSTDGSTISAVLGAIGDFGEMLTTATSAVTKEMVKKIKNNAKFTASIPLGEGVTIFRKAQSTFALEAALTIDRDTQKTSKLRYNTSTSETAQLTEYISSRDKSDLNVKSSSTLYRENYSHSGDESLCNDGNGCDSPFDTVLPKYTLDDAYNIVSLSPPFRYSTLFSKYLKGDDQTAELSKETSVNPQEISLGDIKVVENTYTAPQHEEIEYSIIYDSEELKATTEAVIRHPWNYELSFKDYDKIDEDNDYSGIIVPGEEITTEVVIKNNTNSSVDQEGSGDTSPNDTKVTLYAGAFDDLGSKTNPSPTNNNNIWNNMKEFSSKKIGGIENGETAGEKITFTPEEVGANPGQYMCYGFMINYNNSVDDGMYNDESYYEPGTREEIKKVHAENNRKSNRVICKFISITPTIEVRGGSLYSNGKISLNVLAKGKFGSWVDYGVVSKGAVNTLASGHGFPNNGGDDIAGRDFPLSINNDKASSTSWQTGNNSVVSNPSFISKLDILKNNSIGSGNYLEADSDITISDSLPITIDEFKIFEIITNGGIMYTTGTITIEKDITPSGTDPVILIADGGIEINEGVTKINAWLISTGGAIDTCSNYEIDGGGNILKEKKIGDKIIYYGTKCKNKLTITGPVVANNIELKRTYYGYTSSAGVTDSTSEQFNMGDQTYIWAYSKSKSNAGYTATYSRTLAPRV